MATHNRRKTTLVNGSHDKNGQAGIADEDLANLNSDLAVLQDVFPDISNEVFREMLLAFSADSRVYVVTEALMKDKTKHVRGRWRVQDSTKLYSSSSTVHTEKSLGPERFRSESYKVAVRNSFTMEFRGLNKSVIEAILAEQNHDYASSREKLLILATRSWRLSVANFFTRRQMPSSTRDPNLVWMSGAQCPTIRPVGNFELQSELEQLYVFPVQQKIFEAQIGLDHSLAQQINNTLAQRDNAMYECECCYLSNTFEDLATCSSGAHFVCLQCIRLTINEALFGQGWRNSIDHAKAAIKCVAIASDSDQCLSTFPEAAVCRAFGSTVEERQVLNKLEARLASDAIVNEVVNLLQCNQCGYAEFDAEVRGNNVFGNLLGPFLMKISWQQVLSSFVITLATSRATDSSALSTVCVLAVLLAMLSGALFIGKSNQHHSRSNSQQPNNGSKFICRNPQCEKVTCLRCGALWRDIHSCANSPKDSLRTYVESAITAAVKRTCPICNLSFVKSSGCNKLVCVCGYAMCYLCRSDVTKEGYAHFCPHFRPDGGFCQQCSKCELYKDEDEEKVVREAKKHAEEEWWDHQGPMLSEHARRLMKEESPLGDNIRAQSFLNKRFIAPWSQSLLRLIRN